MENQFNYLKHLVGLFSKIQKMIDIKGSFNTIKPYEWHADKGYLLVFTKDRVLCVNTGISDTYTGNLTGRDALKTTGLFISILLLVGLMAAALYWQTGTEEKDIGQTFIFVIVGALILASIITVRYYHKIVKQQSNRIKTINIDVVQDRSVAEIMALNKDNHELLYSDISKIYMTNSHFSQHADRAGELSFYYGNKKEDFNIEKNENYDICKEIMVSVLSDKLIESRIQFFN